MSYRDHPSVTFQPIPEILVEGRRLGRHVLHDERSKDFPAAMADSPQDVLWKVGGAGWLPLNQGDLGSCTANAFDACRMLGPNVGGRGEFVESDAVNLYRYEVEVIEGIKPFQDAGGSGLAVCKAAKHFKTITSYTHTFSFQDALKALALGPGMLGTNWYDSFDRPDANGLVQITPGAQVRGGHEIAAFCVRMADQLVGFVQSWGEWGVACPDAGLDTGAFYVSFSDLERLLAEQGDFTFPVYKA